MEHLSESIRSKIINYIEQQVKNNMIGASVLEISKKIGHSRITVGKYLEIMKAEGVLEAKTVAQAKIYTIPLKNEKPTILIVDDEPHIVDLVKLSLDSANYNFTEAYSGIDALEKVFTQLPDLIILDLMMPGMDGYEVCKRLKQNTVTENVPILILSAKSKFEDKMEGVEVGADEYITKPFDPKELVSQVRLLVSDNTPHIEHNHITNLPAKKLLIKEINKRLSGTEEFNIVKIDIDNLEKINARLNHQTGVDILHIFGNFLSMKYGEDFVSHIGLKNFVILTQKKQGQFKSLATDYKKFIPFIYSDIDSGKLANDSYMPSLSIKYIPFKDLQDSRGRLETILAT
ncbi:response regulator [Candidatus Woesearchaeota archaeon]|nr:response regulator [Candidatus Woesearchaeota archaeon]